jgi:hypothetical protein
MNNVEENELDSKKEVIQVLLAVAFLAILCTFWALTK